MKILIINHNGGSLRHGPNLRTYYAAKELVSLGHEVTAASSSYSHKYGNLPETRGVVTDEEIDGIQYKWIRCTKYHNLLQRIYSHFEFGLKLLVHRRKICMDADLVIFSGPPPEIFLFAWLYSKLIGSPIVSDVRDLWPRTQLEMNRLQWLNPYTHFLFLCQFLQFAGSRRIISPLPGIRKYLSKFGRTEGVVVIENGFDLDRKPSPENMTLSVIAGNKNLGGKTDEEIELNEIRQTGKIIVGYSGAFDRDNDIDSLVKAAQRLAHREDVLFMLVGDGVRREYLKEAANKLPNLVVCARVASAEVPSVLSVMDVCYCGLKPKAIYQFGVSLAKSFEYMAAAKPILWMVEAFNNPVRESGGGLLIEPGNIGQLVGAIEKCVMMTEAGRREMGRLGFEYLKENHTYNVLGRQWSDMAGEFDARR